MIEIKNLCLAAHFNSKAHGFWDKPIDENFHGSRIALMHSELSEALEAIRHGDPVSDHITDFSLLEEEMADVCIRVFDYCGGMNLRLAEAIVAKMKYNATREHMHGKKL